MEERFERIPLKAIKVSATNPRNSADYKSEDLKSLAASIAESGLLQPVRVRPNPEDPNHTYELIIGERRFRAHLLNKAETIDAIVCDYDDTQVIVAQNTENIQRKDVHALDEAKSLKSLLDLVDPKTKTNKFTVEALALEIGKSKSYIWQTIILVNLIEEYQGIFREGKITKQIAMMLARQTREQQKAVEDWIDDTLSGNIGIDPDDLEFHLEREFHLELADAPFDKADATLLPAAGPCTTCAKSSANNPDLFGDLGKAAKCLDSACFKLKKEACFERNMKMLRKSGEPFVIINKDRPGSKNVLGGDEFKLAKKTDKGAVQAIHTTPEKRGAVEWVKPKRIPMNEVEKTTKKNEASKTSQVQSSKAEADRQKMYELAKIKRLEIFKAMIPKIPSQIDHDLIKNATIAVFENLYVDITEIIMEAHGSDDAKFNNYGRQIDFLESQGFQTAQILWCLLNLGDADIRSDGTIDKEFLVSAKKLGVDVNKIVKEVDARAKAEEEKEKAEQKTITEHSKSAGTIGGIGSKKKK